MDTLKDMLKSVKLMSLLVDSSTKADVKDMGTNTRIAYRASVLGCVYMYATDKRINLPSRLAFAAYGCIHHKSPVLGLALVTPATLAVLCQKNGFGITISTSFKSLLLVGVVMGVGILADEMAKKPKVVKRTNWDDCDSLVVHEPTDTLCFFGKFNDCETWAAEHNNDHGDNTPYHALFLNAEMKHLVGLEWNNAFLSNKPDGWTGNSAL